MTPFVLGFALYKDFNIQLDTFEHHFKKLFNDAITVEKKLTEIRGTLGCYEFVISYVDHPIEKEEIMRIASHNPFFEEGEHIAKGHKAHAVVALKGAGSAVLRYLAFTKILMALAKSYNCVAFYLGEQQLFYGRDFLLKQVETIIEGRLPIPAWIYVGFVQGKEGFIAYTKGMKDFGRHEAILEAQNYTPEKMHQTLLAFVEYMLLAHRTLEHEQYLDIDEGINYQETFSDLFNDNVSYLHYAYDKEETHEGII